MGFSANSRTKAGSSALISGRIPEVCPEESSELSPPASELLSSGSLDGSSRIPPDWEEVWDVWEETGVLSELPVSGEQAGRRAAIHSRAVSTAVFIIMFFILPFSFPFCFWGRSEKYRENRRSNHSTAFPANHDGIVNVRQQFCHFFPVANSSPRTISGNTCPSMADS